MDYELVFLSDMSLLEWARYICDLLKKKTSIKVEYKEHLDYISIGCEYMSFIIETDEIVGMDVIKEVFSFEANMSIRIQIFGRVFKNGIELLFALLKIIIEDRREDFLLLENGSEVILKRTGEDICTHIPKGYETDFPFALLGREIRNA